MTRYFPMFALAAAIVFLAAPPSAKAQYACPPGYASIGGGQDAGGFYGCAQSSRTTNRIKPHSGKIGGERSPPALTVKKKG